MSYFGDFLIFGATLCTLFSAIFYFLAWRGRDRFLNLGRRLYGLTTLLVTATLATLFYLILTHDFSIAYVHAYSSTDLPLGYLLSTLWGGQEGTFLLWLFYTVIFGLVLRKSAGEFERGTMFFLNLFVLSLLFIITKKSPFALSPIFHAEGAGLNPLLQNFWMQIHPPIMFIGFSAATFPFVFAITGLIERKYQLWSEAARRWTMFAWSSLGISLVMGGYWAYETLGWGGFWAWDPVENSSLIPWLFLTTQVHSLFIKRRRRGLMRFSLVVVCLSFWSVLYGTFLTRSGVLADFSVHSFVDLGINAFLVTGLFFFVGLGSFWLMYRWRDIRPEPSFSVVASRSYLVTLGVVILFLGAMLVLLGTSAPLLTRVTETPSNVGMSYYFATMTPISIAILLLISLFPVFRWNSGLSKPMLLILGIAVAIATCLFLLFARVTTEPMYLLLFSFAAWAITVNGYVFFLSIKEKKLTPGYLSHVGLAIALIGAASSAGFESKEVVSLKEGEMVSSLGYNLTFTEVTNKAKGFDCHVTVDGGNGTFAAVLSHEFPKNAEGVMKKPHVHTYASHDVYLAPQAFEPAESNDKGTLFLKKGESATIEKYTFTFFRFDMGGTHGSTSDEMSAKALVTVSYDGIEESMTPSLSVLGNQVKPEAVSFDNSRGSVVIAGVRPEDGGVMLAIAGDFVPVAEAKPATLVVELSRKPLIQLFWIGTMVAFLGGILSMFKRRKKLQSTTISDVESTPAEPNSQVIGFSERA
ncbi:MAG: cytochrome c biogenesis protein CcsA [candidate division Zixibacteria bacterium]|nr:cytochrome c biogenesis protein CcsA [candidate division Zixibacteria bacterium]